MAASTRSIHSRQRAACGRSRSSTSRGSSPSRRSAARGGAHRPYSRNAGRPENSRAAPSATSRSNSRRAARPVIGAWRAASAGETQSWASRRSTIFWAGFEREFGRDGDQSVGAAREIGGEVEGGGGGEGDRACGGVRPGWVAGPWPPSAARTCKAGIQDFRGDQRHGPRPAQPDGEDDVERPKGEDFGFGRGGVREGGERQGGGSWRPPRPDRPPLRKPSGSMRGRSGPRPGRSRAAAAANPAGVEAGRPAGEVAPQLQGASPRAERRRRRRSAGRAARLRRR